MENQVANLRRELGVTKVCSALPSELERGGYRSEDRFTMRVLPDPRAASATGVLPPAERKPHLMLSLFNERVAARKATPFTLRVMAVVEALEADILILDPGFEAPRTSGGGAARGGKVPIRDWSSAAHKLAEKKVGPEPRFEATGDRVFVRLWRTVDC